MKVSDIMTRQVVSIGAAQTIQEAIGLMLDQHLSGLPVTASDGALLGIITEADFLRRSEIATERKRPRWLEIVLNPGFLAQEYVHTHGRRIEEIMTRDVMTVAPDTPLIEAVELMEYHRVKRLPVVASGKMVGIVSRADLLRALASVTEASALSRDDDKIRQHILAELGAQAWGPRALIDVVVHNGVVHLWGPILDERERQGLCVMAENTPGVREVRDHLFCVEPFLDNVMSAL